jgi:hypothetical protein
MMPVMVQLVPLLIKLHQVALLLKVQVIVSMLVSDESTKHAPIIAAPKHCGLNLYSLCASIGILRYQIADHNQDGIYEPGTEIFISGSRYVNNGGLTLPAGALLQFPSTPSAMSANVIELLPEVFTDR